MEPLYGYLVLAEKLYADGPQFSGAWNFGPEQVDCLSVIKVTKNLINISGSKSTIELSDRTGQPHEAGLLKLDISKAKEMLGWRPVLDMDASLNWICDWNKSHQNNMDLRLATLKQISEFQDMVATLN